MALAIAEESDAADGRLTANRELTDKANKVPLTSEEHMQLTFSNTFTKRSDPVNIHPVLAGTSKSEYSQSEHNYPAISKHILANGQQIAQVQKELEKIETILLDEVKNSTGITYESRLERIEKKQQIFRITLIEILKNQEKLNKILTDNLMLPKQEIRPPLPLTMRQITTSEEADWGITASEAAKTRENKKLFINKQITLLNQKIDSLKEESNRLMKCIPSMLEMTVDQSSLEQFWQEIKKIEKEFTLHAKNLDKFNEIMVKGYKEVTELLDLCLEASIIPAEEKARLQYQEIWDAVVLDRLKLALERDFIDINLNILPLLKAVKANLPEATNNLESDRKKHQNYAEQQPRAISGNRFITDEKIKEQMRADLEKHAEVFDSLNKDMVSAYDSILNYYCKRPKTGKTVFELNKKELDKRYLKLEISKNEKTEEIYTNINKKRQSIWEKTFELTGEINNDESHIKYGYDAVKNNGFYEYAARLNHLAAAVNSNSNEPYCFPAKTYSYQGQANRRYIPYYETLN